MKPITTSSLLLLVALLTGCPSDEYILELHPTDTGLDRQLTCWREDKDTNGTIKRLEFPTNELAEISAHYDQHQTLSNHTHVFNGLFPSTLPKDMDGWGQYHCTTSSLGNAYTYMERFRGTTNLVGHMEDRLAAVDEFTDHLLGWMRRELGRHKNYKSLHRAINVGLRKDFKEISLESALSEESSETIFKFKLAERGILAPANYGGFGNSQEWRQFSAFVSSHLGLNEKSQADARLSFLQNENAALLSLSNYLATTKQFKTLCKTWQQEGAEGSPPESTEILMALTERAFEGSLKSTGPDRLKVKLFLPEKPKTTNGKWHETERCLVWEYPLPDRSSEYYNIAPKAYVVWSKPNVEFQNKHFGKVVLPDESLIQYCQWYAALTRRQQTEWDSMLSTLTPQSIEVLMDFRFQANKPGTSDGSLEDYARNLIVPKSKTPK